MIDAKIYREMGLNDAEYAQVEATLGREPTLTELGMYAVMWSEHCGYKYSRPVLRLFKKYKEAMDTGAVENAGVIDIGDNQGLVMKMEFHNHPSRRRAVPGRGDGRGRHPARHLHHGRPPHRHPELPPLRAIGRCPNPVFL